MIGAQQQARPEPEPGWVQGLDAAPGATGVVYLMIWSNGKGYVGETGTTLRERFSGHLYDLCVRRKNNKLMSGWRKNGTAELIVLATGLNDTAARKATEVRFVAHYQTFGEGGYNSTPGGDANPMDVPELRTKHRNAMRSSQKARAALDALHSSSEQQAHLAALNSDPEFQANRLVQLAALRTDPEVQAKLSVSLRTSSKAQAARAISRPVATAVRVYKQSATAAARDCAEWNARDAELFADPIYHIAVTDALRLHAERRAERRYQHLLDRATDEAMSRRAGVYSAITPTRRATRADIRRTSDIVASAISAVFDRAEIAAMADRIAVAGSMILSRQAAHPS